MANIIRIKRSTGSNVPETLANAELAFSELSKILYIGVGTSGANSATIEAIGGLGAFVSLGSTAQTIEGVKTFSGAIVLGTPGSGTLTNCTGLPVSTGVSGLGTGVATFLATPSSANLASAVTGGTGTGALVFATSPTLVTPTLGVAAATTINKVTITAPATGSTLTVADGKTLTASNTLTFTGTDASSVAFGAGGTVVYTSGLGTGVATFLATPSSANLASAVTGGTGTGALVFGTSPSLTTPSLSSETYSTSATVTAGTNAVGQGNLTSDYNIITTTANNPSGVTLPKAATGRRVIVVNKGTNAINVYPSASGGGDTIDSLIGGLSIQIPVSGIMEFNASTTAQWYSSGSSTFTAPNLGTPTALVGTNITGTASGFTAGAVTNAGLTGEVTTSGLTATLSNSAVIGKVLTGFTSGAGAVAATDTILQAIQKIDGNTSAGIAAAGNLTGATLASNVLASSLTSVGTLASLTVTAAIVGSVTGNAGTVTTNANLTGAITSSGNTTSLGSFTSAQLSAALDQKTGNTKVVFDTSPTLITPTIGVATATSVNKVTITAPATGSTLTIAEGKTLTASNTLTFTGTDASSVAFGAGGTVVYTSGLDTGVATFLATPSSANLISAITDETGTGSLVFSASPTFTGTLNCAALTSTGNVTVGGDLLVNGTTTTINSTVTTLDDPIITLGGDGNGINDDKDRGVEFKWNNGTAKVGFFGFDESTGYFTFIPQATNSSEVFTGTKGDIEATNFRGALIGNADTVTTNANLTGAITSSGNTTSLGTASFSSANLAGALTDKTGTGLAVFATAPTLDSLTVTGDAAVNGGDITTTAATATVFNTTATNLSIGGAATTLTLGATSGTALIRNATTKLGNTTATITTTNTNPSGTNTNHLTIQPQGSLILAPTNGALPVGSVAGVTITNAGGGAGTVKVAGGDLVLGVVDPDSTIRPVNIIFEGATDNGFDTTLTVTDPTGNRTITLPDATDTLVGKATTDTLTNKTLTTPKIAQINDTNGLAVLKTGTTASAVNEVTITNNIATQAPHVSATGTDTNISLHLAPKGTGSYVVVQNGTDGTKQIAIGVAGATTSTTTFLNAAQTVNRTITLPDATDTLVGKATTDTLTNKTWNSNVIAGEYGGTGVANTSKTITLGGNLTTSGAFTTTLTATANTSVTLPTSGTLLNDSVTIDGGSY